MRVPSQAAPFELYRTASHRRRAHVEGPELRARAAHACFPQEVDGGQLMRMKHEQARNGAGGWIDEGDPLPPENRQTPEHGDWIERVYRDHSGSLLRYARRYAFAHRAGDIVQTLFARLAARGEGGNRDIDAPAAYLRKGVRNLIRDEARNAQRRAMHLHVHCEDIDLAGPDPTGALEARDMLMRLEAVIARLEPRTREIFLAHRIDGYSYGEIAVRTGLSVKTVEKHMSRAIAAIARHAER